MPRLLASFAVILAGALLFTNAVEWLGHRLALGEGAVGSLLAAVGTAMPETLIPIVALIGGEAGSEDVAIGAIVGAPFLLATVAMALVGFAALGYRRRRPQGRDLRPMRRPWSATSPSSSSSSPPAGAGHRRCRRRCGSRPRSSSSSPICVYVQRTLARAGPQQPEETLNPLIIDPARAAAAATRRWPRSSSSLLVGLGAMVGGAHLFVDELLEVADSIGVEALVLSLVLAPLATELPEKANSFFWVRDGKDSLALGNITGAMVFQSTIPIAVGLAFTDWELDRFAAVSMVLGLAGGAVAYWALRLRGRFDAAAIAAWTALYAFFLVYVIAS